MPLPSQREERLRSLWSGEVRNMPPGMAQRGQLSEFDPLQALNLQALLGGHPDILLRFLQLGGEIGREQGTPPDNTILQLIHAILTGKQK